MSIDVSKAFDYLSHDLLLAKLDGYGFKRQALKCILSALRDRSNKSRLIVDTVSGGALIMEFLKDLFSVNYFLMFTFITYLCWFLIA